MKRFFKPFFLISLLLIVVLSGCTSKEEQEAVAAFKEASQKATTANQNLDQAVSDAQALLDAGDPPLDSATGESLETAISTAKTGKVEVPEQPKDVEAIKSETEKLNAIDYTAAIQALSDAKTAYETSVKQMKQVTAPAEDFVIECLQSIEGITGIEAATEDNDPNGNLGKPGAYIAQIYFSHSSVDQDRLFGDSIIEKGTDSGGSIEVYNTVEDAEKRDKYLASFDGTFVASGSHKVVGTVIVRTSNELTASQQKELEESIIANLTELK